MKRLSFTVFAIVLAFSLSSAACSPAQTPATQTTQNVTGQIIAINTTPAHNHDTVTILTANGQVTLNVTPNSTFNLNSQACSLLDLTTVMQQGNTTYNCTAVYDTTYGITLATVWTAQNQTGQ